MYFEISDYESEFIRIRADKRFLAVLADWLTPYVKREIKKVSEEYGCCSWREAFDQVLIKEDGVRFDKFLIYEELIDMNEDYDLAKINE